MSIMQYNGCSIIAMKGKNCVGIASDNRLGAQAQTVSCNFRKIFRMNDKLYVGLAGLATDVQTIENKLRFQLIQYELQEERNMEPNILSNVLSNILYEKRFGPYFIEPIVAGLDSKNQPFLSSMDYLGALTISEDFAVSGTASSNMYGMCESFYKKDMCPEQLFETLSQSLLSSVDRDALSGWGAVVHIITKDGLTSKELKGRMD